MPREVRKRFAARAGVEHRVAVRPPEDVFLGIHERRNIPSVRYPRPPERDAFASGDSIEQPGWADHLSADSATALGERSVCRHEDHALAASSGGGEGHEGVVSPAGRVHDLNASGDALLRAAASLALQHNDDRLGQPRRTGRTPNALDEIGRRLGAVPPPPGRTRPDDVGGVDEEHEPSLHSEPATKVQGSLWPTFSIPLVAVPTTTPLA